MLLKNPVPELGGSNPSPFFEDTAEVIGIGVAGIDADLFNAQVPVH